MRSFILCGGFDDVLIWGYYLRKTQGWNYDPKGSFSNFYKFPQIDTKRQVVEIYKREEDLLGIWSVGGKDAFEPAFKFINKINIQNPDQGINKVFIVTDRDNNEIDSSLDSFVEKMKRCGFDITKLHNMQANHYFYEIEDEMYCLDIIPIIIPFDRTGALETVLMDGIAETGDEESYIVDCANKYIDGVLDSGRLHKYLQHERYILKAKLSAVISITNPDRSTALLDRVLMSWEWENKDAVRRHFEAITENLESRWSI